MLCNPWHFDTLTLVIAELPKLAVKHCRNGCRSVTDTYSSGGDDLFIHPPLMNRYYVSIDTHDCRYPFIPGWRKANVESCLAKGC